VSPTVTHQQPTHMQASGEEDKTLRATDTITQGNKPEAADVSPEQTAPEEPALPSTPAEPAAQADVLPEKPQKAVSAKKGDMVSALATREYGSLTDTIFDIIKRANPGIEDLNRIFIGDEIVLPPLDIESLIIKEDDGTYSIHLATFASYDDGQQLQKTLSNNDYQASLHPVKIVGNQTWHRVTLGNFPDQASAIEYVKSFDLESRLLPFPVDAIQQSLKSMRSTY